MAMPYLSQVSIKMCIRDRTYTTETMALNNTLETFTLRGTDYVKMCIRDRFTGLFSSISNTMLPSVKVSLIEGSIH